MRPHGLLHADLERRWEERFGTENVERLRSALQGVLDRPTLAVGLEPPPGAWRLTKRYIEQTQAVLADPLAASTPLPDRAPPRRLARRELMA